IKYAFDKLLEILIHIIEYYVSLVHQKEDTLIIRKELFSIITSDKSQHERFNIGNSWSKISLKDIQVVFKKENSTREIIIPEFEISRGSKIGIIGESGAGKTSIFNVILNAIDFKGGYFIDDQSAKGLEFNRESISLITSNDPLFNISLRENILLGKDISAEKIARVLNGVRAKDFISSLEEKRGDSDFNLSAGQEQRIRLARGLLQDSEIYLLDEPFNGLDSQNKTQIMKFMSELLKDRTVVLVTHNPEELKFIDKLYKFEDSELKRI
ncbi:MAG: ATP-binding cassette domain-containing protein, partial [Bdellovibrionales bacterium]|nr:ATP-binding cassette domain-containing protein [Bdellovibrionales bacterium]